MRTATRAAALVALAGTGGCAGGGEAVVEPAVLHGEAGERAHAAALALAEEGFSGAVVVEVRDTLVLMAGYGHADRAAQRPFTPSTITSVGSLTKQFTAAGVATLAVAGALDLHAPLGRSLPELSGTAAGLTPHQLLTHSAGLPEYCGDDFDRLSRAGFIDRCLSGARLVGEPGTGYAYSNPGYSALAVLIERVVGRDHEDYLREALFGPIGMTRTGYPGDLPRAAQATGYAGESEWGTLADRLEPLGEDFWALKGNGGLHSTAEDMYAWHRALRGDGGLADTTVALLFGPHQPRGENAFYGYGWGIHLSDDVAPLQVSHSGSNGIFSARWVWRPRERILVIVLSNAAPAVGGTAGDGPVADRAASAVFRAVRDS